MWLGKGHLEVTDFIFRLSVCFPAPQIIAAVRLAAQDSWGPPCPAALWTKVTSGRAGCSCGADRGKGSPNCLNSGEAWGFFFFSKMCLRVKKNSLIDSLQVLQGCFSVRQNFHGKCFILLSQHVYFCQLQLTRIQGNRCSSSVVWLLFLATFPSSEKKKVLAKIHDLV